MKRQKINTNASMQGTGGWNKCRQADVPLIYK
jgi:hypothetical protein